MHHRCPPAWWASSWRRIQISFSWSASRGGRMTRGWRRPSVIGEGAFRSPPGTRGEPGPFGWPGLGTVLGAAGLLPGVAAEGYAAGTGCRRSPARPESPSRRRPKPVPRGPARWETPQLPPQRRFDHWQVLRGWKQPVRRPPGWAGRGEPGRPGRAGRTAAAAEGPAEFRAGSASGARRFCLKRGKGPGKPPRPDLWRGRVPARW